MEQTKVATEAAGAARAPSIRRLFENASIYAVGQAFVSVLSFITDPILSHLLTVADFGLLGLTRTLTNFQSTFYRLGLDGAANRIFFATEDDESARRRALGTINTLLLGWTLALTIAQEAFGPAIYRRLFGDIPYAPFGRFVAYALLCGTLISLAQVVWSAQERARLVAGIRLGTALLGSAITFGLFFATHLGVLSIFIAQATTTTIMLALHMRYTYRAWGFAWDTAAMRRALAFGLPMVVHLTSHWALELADRLLLEKLASRDAVGLYTVAYGTTSTLMMINGSVNTAYVPQFMKSYGKPGQETFVAQAITYFLLVVSTATLGFVIFAPSVIRTFYASKFVEAASLTPILALAAPLHAIYLIHVNALFQAERTRMIPVLTFLAGMMNIGLNIWWIPRYGIVGAAWATAVGYAALAAFFTLGARRVISLSIEGGRLARLLVTFCAIFGMTSAVDGRLPIAWEIAAKVMIALAAPVLLVVTGFPTADERRTVREKVASLLVRFGGKP